MLGGIIALASYGLSTGGTIGNILYTLEQNGVFSYLLPFFLIFAITYGILIKTGIFANRGINFILALSVSLMALQMNFVSYFFREIFPRMGVVLAMIVVGIILLGLFFDFEENKNLKKWATVIVGAMLIIIVIQSLIGASWFTGFGYSTGIGYWFRMYGWYVFSFVVFGLVMAAIVFGGKEKDDKKKKKKSISIGMDD
ncbi:MAG: hypothetical protein PF542_04985 [Nanoarchaeota archaeon]|jgi:uncharacterized membrane protein YozB (DUF420 family)|nr:hypothetical protein [Nanoarchaeota archaeon]